MMRRIILQSIGGSRTHFDWKAVGLLGLLCFFHFGAGAGAHCEKQSTGKGNFQTVSVVPNGLKNPEGKAEPRLPVSTRAEPARACQIIIKMLPGIYPAARNVQFPQTQSTDVLIGQRVILEATVYGPNGKKLNNVTGTWGVSGLRIKDWVAYVDASAVVKLRDFSKPTIDFCWVEKGPETVTYEVTYNGKQSVATAIFTVYAPQVEVTSRTTKVRVDPFYASSKGLTAIHFGFGDNAYSYLMNFVYVSLQPL